VHWEPDAAPSRGQLAELQRILQDHKAGITLWEGELLPQTVKVLKLMGINSVVFDPCGNVPGQGDLMTVIHQNVANLAKAFQ